MIELEILDSVWTRCDKLAAQLLNDDLSFTKKEWGGGKGCPPIFETVRLIEARGCGEYLFPTGLVSKAYRLLKEYGENVKITGSAGSVEYDEPYIEGVTFRYYQKELAEIALESGRGVIQAATGTGKSIIISAIISAFSQEKILFLVHTKDLVTQMKRRLSSYFGNIGEWSGSKKDIQRITVSTVQSYSKVCEQYCGEWDVVIVDEGHHISSWDGNYAYVLKYTAAPVKYAFTATPPYSNEGKMVLEALIGPVIGSYDVAEAADDGVLSTPQMRIIEIGEMPAHLLYQKKIITDKDKKKESEYAMVYRNGIVENTARNIRIAHETNELFKQGLTVLINVIKKQHGFILEEMINRLYPDVKAYFVHGTSKDRESVIKKFTSGKLRVVIATTIFNEGVDIPGIGACINAAGGKSEIATLQKVGRGLRKTEEKSSVIIVDFKDTCHVYFKNHFNLRRKMYIAKGWIKKNHEIIRAY